MTDLWIFPQSRSPANRSSTTSSTNSSTNPLTTPSPAPPQSCRCNAHTICTAAAHRGTTEHFSRTTFHPRPVCGSQLCGRNFMLPSPHSFECFAFLFPALVSSALIFLYFVMRGKKCRSFGVSSVFFLWEKALKENLQEDTGILRNTQGVKTQE